jgi:hypothetical protein
MAHFSNDELVKKIVLYVDKYGLYYWYRNTIAYSPPFQLSSVLLFNTNELTLYRNLNLLFHAFGFSWYKNLLSKILSDGNDDYIMQQHDLD